MENEGPARKIVSASRRTDIPALYSRWLLRRIEAGSCEWIAPFGGRLCEVSLRPEDVLALVFWTRNPSPLLPALGDLRSAGYSFYFHFTITGYPREVEVRAPPLGAGLRAFRAAAEKVGPEALIWRYDPVLLGTGEFAPARHLERFREIAPQIRGATREVYFSFSDFYGKTRKNLDAASIETGIAFRDPDRTERREIALRLRDIAASNGMSLHACCEDALVDPAEGILKGHCVDIDKVRRLRPDAKEDLKRRPTRKECGCTESVDIGAYDTCIFGCAYCYATRSRAAALARARHHDPDDTLLWRPPSLSPP
jgi:hypothetical protein